jgi:NAD(P)-dependent dehydrogenase (short-subunit alcohol dehydrogenase family)
MANMSTLSNKVAIVTGASKGIGGGIATALGSAGARVAVNYSSDREGAELVAKRITDNGGEAIAVGADVSKAVDVERFGPTAGASSTSALSPVRIRWRGRCCTRPRKAPSKR